MVFKKTHPNICDKGNLLWVINHKIGKQLDNTIYKKLLLF